MDYSPDFLHAVQLTLQEEGIFAEVPGDRGGKTKYGITEAIWVAHRERRRTPIEEITKADAIEIYYKQFWLPLRLDALGERDVSAEIFDTAVNCGVVTAARIAQRACNVLNHSNTTPLVEDGHLGLLSHRALKALCNSGYRVHLLAALNVFQGMRYFEIIENDPSQKKFVRGWLRRCRVIISTHEKEGGQ